MKSGTSDGYLNNYQLENWALLGYYATSSCNFLPTFRINFSVPSSRVKHYFWIPDRWRSTTRCLITQISAVFIYFAEKSLSHPTISLSGRTLFCEDIRLFILFSIYISRCYDITNIYFSNTKHDTASFKKMDSISYVNISWTIHGMWMIYITFERGGPKFSNTTARGLA